jgi:hypothetical protein
LILNLGIDNARETWMRTSRKLLATAVGVLALAITLPAHAESGSILDSIKSGISSFFSGSGNKSTAVSAEGFSRPQQIDAAMASIAYSSDYSANAQRINSTNVKNCTAINQSASEWKTVSIQRSQAPSPVNVIRDSSCFPDVQGIKIPRTGFDFLDSLMPQLLKLASSTECNSTSGFWDSVVSKAKSGDLNGLMGSSINSATKYIAQKIEPVTSKSYSGPASNIGPSQVGNADAPMLPAAPSIDQDGPRNPKIRDRWDNEDGPITYIP